MKTLQGDQREFMLKLFGRIYTHAKRLIEQNGEHTPILILLKKDDLDVISFAEFATSDLQASMILAYQLDPAVVGTIFVSEAWLLKVDKNSAVGKRLLAGRMAGIKPSESPDREEVVVLIAETKRGALAAKAPMLRRAGRVTLGELEIPEESVTEIKGALVGGFAY